MNKLNAKIYGSTTTKIGNLVWKVYLVDKFNKNLYWDDDIKHKKNRLTSKDGAFATTATKGVKVIFPDHSRSTRKLSLFIRGDLKANLMKATIIHEVSHAYIYTYSTIFANKTKIDEERFCYAMEQYCEGIYKTSKQIYRDLRAIMRDMDIVVKKKLVK